MKIQKFTDLEVWKQAHVLVLLIYEITENFPSSEIYGLVSQLRRAAVSVESCIAEGFNRFHYKERINFYYDARGSLGEVESQSITSKDLNFISEVDFQRIIKQIEKVNIVLSGLIRSTVNLSKG